VRFNLVGRLERYSNFNINRKELRVKRPKVSSLVSKDIEPWPATDFSHVTQSRSNQYIPSHPITTNPTQRNRLDPLISYPSRPAPDEGCSGGHHWKGRTRRVYHS